MGLLAMIYFVAIGCLGALYLEVINYIEHYGLERKKLENGEYEKVNI
jgi:alkane 1-monooxygenase